MKLCETNAERLKNEFVRLKTAKMNYEAWKT
jgi:hypothetical protein